MAAVLAEGETVMENCAREPEVVDLADLLTKMGANIEGAGTSTIRVRGVDKLHGAKHRIIPDRIEAATFIIAGALTGGDLLVTDCVPLTRRRCSPSSNRPASLPRQWRVDSRDGRQSAAGRRHHHRRVSRLRHRRAGAIHGAGDAGRRHLA